jgi:prephenate dehydrogenase
MTPADQSDPPFGRVGIVGLGLIGGSIAYGIRQAWPGTRLAGVDAPEIAALARRRGAIDDARSALHELNDCDAVILSVPVPEIASLVQDAASLGRETLVTDVGSTKRRIMQAAGDRLTFIGGHPIAGAARGGLDRAHADLFRGRPWLLVPGAAAPDEAIARLERLVHALGAIPRRTDAETHDRVMAYVSHLPQLVANTLMCTAGTAVGADGLGVSGPGFADMTRLASSSSEMWRGILSTNADYIAEALRVFQSALPAGDGAVADASKIEDAFRQANEWFALMTDARAASGNGGRSL